MRDQVCDVFIGPQVAPQPSSVPATDRTLRWMSRWRDPEHAVRVESHFDPTVRWTSRRRDMEHAVQGERPKGRRPNPALDVAPARPAARGSG
jgi:hypothetical protein